MSIENEKLLRQLEQATALDLDSEVSLDEETKSLRDAWLAMGDLLDSQPTCDSLPIPKAIVPAQPARSRIMGWVVAASLMLALSALWIFNQPKSELESPAPQLVQDSNVPTRDTIPQPAASTKEVPAELLAWDNSLDEDISLISAAVDDLEQNWYGNNGDVRTIYDELEDFSSDMNETSL